MGRLKRNQPRMSFVSQSYTVSYDPERFQFNRTFDSTNGGFSQDYAVDRRTGQVYSNQVTPRPPLRQIQTTLPQYFTPLVPRLSTQSFRPLPLIQDQRQTQIDNYFPPLPQTESHTPIVEEVFDDNDDQDFEWYNSPQPSRIEEF